MWTRPVSAPWVPRGAGFWCSGRCFVEVGVSDQASNAQHPLAGETPADPWDPWVRAMEDLCFWSEAQERDPSAVPPPDRVGRLMATFEDGVVDELPLSELFRLDGFSDIEETALAHCTGRVLDVGSAGGAAALELQNRDFVVAALDQHAGAGRVLQRRGVGDVRVGSVLDDAWRRGAERWDTLLFVMNGLGLCGDLVGLRQLLERCAGILTPGGSVLADGCDLRLSPAADEAGRIDRRRELGRWFGEAEVLLRYVPRWPALDAADQSVEGSPFRWLYVDAETLARVAEECGWRSAVVMEDGSDYLVRLVRG